jgi:sugar/nucleoside kinase (ribokinase family)
MSAKRGLPSATRDSGIRPLASNLYDSSRCRLLILKLGERGVLLLQFDHGRSAASFVIDSFVDRLIDAVGAGDAPFRLFNARDARGRIRALRRFWARWPQPSNANATATSR